MFQISIENIGILGIIDHQLIVLHSVWRFRVIFVRVVKVVIERSKETSKNDTTQNDRRRNEDGSLPAQMFNQPKIELLIAILN